MGDLKGDLINGAYSKLRISGLTAQPSAEDVELALHRLENLASELGACTGYNFENTPDTGSPHHLKREFWDSFESILAFWLQADFGKGQMADPVLTLAKDKAYSFLAARTAKVRETTYPSRMPIGAANTLKYGPWQKYYHAVEEPSLACSTVRMYVDDIDDFTEDFNEFLTDTETVASYVLTADTGLTVVSESLSSPVVSYRIRADGLDTSTQFNVKIIATTSTGRKITRLILFELTEVD